MASAFVDKSHVPEPAELERVLGASAALWRELIERISARFAPVGQEWTHAGKASGWSLRLKRGTRAILYLTPHEGEFTAAFALGEKAVALAGDAGLPEGAWQAIETARRYAEGRAVRLPVTTRADLDAITTIADAKMAT